MSSKILDRLVVGFAIFAMFFGAGNLIYPLYIGTQTLSQYYSSTLGITLTGIILPFFGLISMTLYRGRVCDFFSGLGRFISLPLIIIILALIGPFVAIPRCIVISFGGVKALIDGAQLVWFDLIFCFLLLVIVWRKAQVVEVLGKWLTPILLINILVIITSALLSEPTYDSSAQNISNFSAFLIGAMEGYQTMDLCAAIFFGAITFDYIKNISGDEKIITSGIISFSIGLFLLFLVYAAFVYIGSKYSTLLMHLPREQMLIAVTHTTLGRLAAPAVALTIVIACLTTAIALVDLVVEWIVNEFNMLKRQHAVLYVVSLSFIFALFGFHKLTMALGLILSYLYPSLITITLANIIDNVFSLNLVRASFWVAFIVTIAYNALFYLI